MQLKFGGQFILGLKGAKKQGFLNNSVMIILGTNFE